MKKYRNCWLYLVIFLIGCGGSKSDRSDGLDEESVDPLSKLVISEASSSNAVFEDEDGDTPDWFELYNGSDEEISLDGFTVTDDSDDPAKWGFSDITLLSNEYVLIWASGKDKKYHTNFKLSSKGETLSLFAPNGRLINELDVFGLVPDKSIGLSELDQRVVYYNSPTPGRANTSDEYAGIVMSSISFSHDGGEFDGSSVTLSSSSDEEDIHFTLDSSLPKKSSPIYSDAIEILENTVIRASIFKPDFIPSETFTRTYIVSNIHSLPIVTLVSEPKNFFDELSGIYEFGPEENYDSWSPFLGANFWQDWERDIHFSFYEPNGELGVALDAGVKIFGGFSRSLSQKSLSIFARGRYGSSELEYPLFPSLSYDSFQAVVLRNTGNDWMRACMRDVLSTSLMVDAGLEVQAARPVAVYLNGEYWGFYNLREKINEHFLDAKINVSKSEINLLEKDAEVLFGSNDNYLQLIDFVKNNSLVIDANYNHVASKIDVDNFITYNVAQIYINNQDWPHNNIKFWNSPSTKWRWILFDTDFGWGLNGESHYFLDSLSYALGEEIGERKTQSWATVLLSRLLERDEFRNKFINHFAYHVNSTFAVENVLASIDKIVFDQENEMFNHFERWEGDYNSNVFNIGSPIPWENRVDSIRTYAELRSSLLMSHFVNYFQLEGTYAINISISDVDAGAVRVNELQINLPSWSGEYFQGIPVSIVAIPNVGWSFSHWEGDVQSSEKIIELNSTENVTISPVFLADNP